MSPVPARATLVELPSRSKSTVRRPSIPIPSPRQLASARPLVVEAQASPKAIKKEKTKSRVWGLLGIRTKRSKDVLTKPALIEPIAAPPKPTFKQDQDTLTPSRSEFPYFTGRRMTDAQFPNESRLSTPSRLTRRNSIPPDRLGRCLHPYISLSHLSTLNPDLSCRHASKATTSTPVAAIWQLS